MLQLRDKLRDKGESLPLATALQDLCQRHGALLIINDHVDVAASVGSGGVHVGQTDLPVAQARQVLSPQQVLGRSNREYEQLEESIALGADHVAFGAIYATTSKGVARNPQGPERVQRGQGHRRRYAAGGHRRHQPGQRRPRGGGGSRRHLCNGSRGFSCRTRGGGGGNDRRHRGRRRPGLISR